MRFLINSYSEIASIDEKKKSAELQNRSYEVEVDTGDTDSMDCCLLGIPFLDAQNGERVAE